MTARSFFRAAQETRAWFWTVTILGAILAGVWFLLTGRWRAKEEEAAQEASTAAKAKRQAVQGALDRKDDDAVQREAMEGVRPMKRKGRKGAALLLVCSCFAASVEIVKAEQDCEAPRASWCRFGYSCVPSECLAALRAERDEARADVAALRLVKRRPVQPWATVGAEYLLNDGAYRGYALAGVRAWRLNLWGGTFGSEPAAGVGWIWDF